MRRQWKLYLLALGFLLGVTFNVLGQGPTFTTIDFPGAAGTQAWGINTRGDVVGEYTVAGVTHGFLLSGGNYTAIDFPGATSTRAVAINPRGDIVGSYTSAGVTHGFLLSGGNFTPIDFRGATSSEVLGINPRGDIAGDYSLASVNPCCAPGTHGFLLSGDNLTMIDFPDATFGYVSGINPGGDVVGTYDTGAAHGYRLSDGDFTSFEFPGSTFTNALAINARGDIAGRYLASGMSHGYLLSGGQFSTIDFPGATFSGAISINQRGDIVGRYRKADGVFHGFLLAGFPPACAIAMAATRIAATAGGAAVTHSSDFTLVTASKPTMAREVLSLFATGLGPTRPSVALGQPFPCSPLAVVDSLVEVRVNGRSAVVLGAVGPGAVDGYQVNFRVPADAVKGLATIQLSAAGVAAAPVNIMVQ